MPDYFHRGGNVLCFTFHSEVMASAANSYLQASFDVL